MKFNLLKIDIMKKIILILIFVVFLSGCGTTDISSLEGNWVDKKTEFKEISFIKSDGILWMENFEGKYKINQKGKRNFVTVNKIEYPIVIIKEQSDITIGETIFIPENNSLKEQFQGTWKNSDKNILFEVTNSNGGILWDIKKGEDKSVRYYPKLTEEGFTFTYDNKQLFFILKKGYIEDSNGLKYYKVSI